MKNKIRELRAERGITQEALGILVGVSRRTIISIENDRFDPSLPLAFRIADTFGFRIEDVFQPAHAAGLAEPSASPDEK
jgi:putative transcriptional regulator